MKAVDVVRLWFCSRQRCRLRLISLHVLHFFCAVGLHCRAGAFSISKNKNLLMTQYPSEAVGRSEDAHRIQTMDLCCLCSDWILEFFSNLNFPVVLCIIFVCSSLEMFKVRLDRALSNLV